VSSLSQENSIHHQLAAVLVELDQLRRHNAAWCSQLATSGAFADFVFDPSFLDIVEACKSPQISSQLHNDLAKEKDGARRLDRLCSTLIATALKRCGLWSDGQAVMSLDEICQRMNVRFERRPQIKRLVRILQEDNWVRGEPDGYRWIGENPPDYSQIAADAAMLEADFPFAGGAAGTLLRCIAALPGVLSGKLSPVAVLFSSGSVTELEVFYSRFPLLALANAMVAGAVTRLAEIRNGRPLRVLEVGAGTWALTAALLPAIGERLDQYVYSDISPSFLAHGLQKFSQCAALRAMTLDIDKDPATQGLNDESFDLVLGANVVHATPDIRRSIRHLRRALRTGGHLVLVETVAPSRVADCTVGLFDGWWSFRDSTLRDGYPVLSMQQWQELLREEGFRVAVMPVGNQDGSSQTSVAILIAVKLGAQYGFTTWARPAM